MRATQHSSVPTVLLLGLALAAATGVATGDQPSPPEVNASDETRDALDVPSLDGPDTYAGNHTWLRLWSGDDDRTPSEQLGDGRFGFEASLAASTDVPFERPLTAPARWNARNAEAYEDSGIHTSRYPEGTAVTDGEFLRDAYVEIYAIDPSTILHADGATTQYVGSSGTVHAISDVRIPQSFESESGAVERAIEDVTETETEVTLFHEGRRLDSGSGQQTTLQFDGLSDGGTLRVEADIRAELEVETRRCTDWDDESSSCDGEWNTSVSEQVGSITVDAERTVATNGLDVTNRTRVALRQEAAGDRQYDHTPQQSSTEAVGGVAVEPSGHWSSVQIGPNASVGSHLRFYSRSPDGWEQLVVAGPDGTTTTESDVRPLQLHAYPGPDGLQPSESVEVQEVTGDVRDGPTLGPRIDLDVPSQYRQPEGLAAIASVQAPEHLRTVSVQGIVPGRQRTVPLPAATPERPVDLDVRVQGVNATHDRVTATAVENATGAPISVGHVEIAGERHPVDDGSVSVAVESPPRRITASYHPPSWLDADRIYEPTEESAKRSTSPLGVVDVVDFVLWMGLVLLPLSLVVVGVDYVTDGRLLGIVDTDR